MSALTTRAILLQNIAKGKATAYNGPMSASTASTVANAAGGNFNLQMFANSIGTTLPSTFQGMPIAIPTGNPSRIVAYLNGPTSGSTARSYFLAHFYKFGTQVLTSTGDQFTHDAATFPVLRTQFGSASQPVTLLPFINITTATTVTAPVVRLRTNAGGAGYKNQSGSNIVGTLSITMPSATTAVNSSFPFKLEYGDSGVQDIIAIETTTAATAGAATIWGVELLGGVSICTPALVAFKDSLFSGIGLDDLRPAVATSGTATTFLGMISIGAQGAATPQLCLEAVYDV